jgi:peptidoglycan/xylan/chitin deacetylase (PgdA/CDA1 family)
MAVCGPDTLGPARTLTLKREFAAYGATQHAPLPLAPGEVVLTFDDGPRPETAAQVLRALADQCAKATFMAVGGNLAQFPELARQELAQGHSIGLHSYAHPHPKGLSPSEQLADLKQAEDAYRAVFGTAAPAYRFPFLEETPTLMSAMEAEKLTVMSIDVGIDDWQPDDTTEKLVTRLVGRLKVAGGGIILMHDANAMTAASMPALLKALKDTGYKVVHLEWEK